MSCNLFTFVRVFKWLHSIRLRIDDLHGRHLRSKHLKHPEDTKQHRIALYVGVTARYPLRWLPRVFPTPNLGQRKVKMTIPYGLEIWTSGILVKIRSSSWAASRLGAKKAVNTIKLTDNSIEEKYGDNKDIFNSMDRRMITTDHLMPSY